MTSAFDPAAWLVRAERCGYTIYLWDGHGTGELGIMTLEPDLSHSRGRHPDNGALWRDLRGDPATAEMHEDAPYGYLLKAGRIGPPKG